ncbi:caspase domain protein [Dictyocaulus viviparus]|uniref:Caspase domain protein n=1 Tax=Dictyocaulus viviparus TaxID=29172 RepID=A0A0D8Y0N2_DICVI|nr:caspase domain protein [Dictyocaulus viviparus]
MGRQNKTLTITWNWNQLLSREIGHKRMRCDCDQFMSSLCSVENTKIEKLLFHLLGVGEDDDILSIYSFLETLNARNAPLLAGKPKLIFIQACRGVIKDAVVSPVCQTSDRRDTGATYLDQTDTRCQQLDGPFGLFNCMRPAVVETSLLKPRESDFLIAYATPPTYVSWRNSLHGSWFVQAICEVFAKHARNVDILQLLTMINRTSSSYVIE